MAELVLCVDVGSTFTKGALVDVGSGELVATASAPTTPPEVLHGVAQVAAAVREEPDDLVLCSSAGGGLRLAVVGYEELVTAEAGRRVALSAGGRVVALSAGPLDAPGIERLRLARPDLVVLVGGTDGGNGDVLVHNARRIGTGRLPAPVVLAGNADVADRAAAELTARGRTVTVTPNVLPRIGELDPLPARTAIRAAFLEHVIGGKKLSSRSTRIAGRTFAQLVRAPTPDAVLSGVELLARARGHDVMLVDVGGATTDVYSVVDPGRAAGGTPEVAGVSASARTVEGDLGMRWSATGVVEAARAEGLGVTDALAAHAAGVTPGLVPVSRGERDGDELLAALAVTLAVRRHGRPERAGGSVRPLRDVGLVVGSGGVLRHADAAARERILRPLLSDHAGGWAVPDRADLAVDADYVLFAAGLLAERYPGAAAELAGAVDHGRMAP